MLDLSPSVYYTDHKQTVIGTNPWVIHRDKEIFGEDVDAFRPERWLNGNQSRLGMHYRLSSLAHN